MAKYILDENNNKIEVTDEVLTATVNEVKCCVSSTPFKMAFISQAKYNELEAAGLVQPNTIYEITDDTTADDMDAQLLEINTSINDLRKYIETTKKMYEHNISFNYEYNGGSITLTGWIRLTIINNKSETITNDTLLNYISLNEYKMATGYLKSSDNILYIVYGVSKSTLEDGSEVYRISTITTSSGNNIAHALNTNNIISVTDFVKTIN